MSLKNKLMTGMAGIGLVGLLAAPANAESNRFTSLLKGIMNIPVQAVRATVGLTGFDITNGKYEMPFFNQITGRAVLDAVDGTREYVVNGVLLGDETKKIEEQSLLDKYVDETGLFGNMVRGGIQGAGYGALWGNFWNTGVNIGQGIGYGAEIVGAEEGIKELIKKYSQ